MALTPEQQAQVDIQLAVETSRNDHQTAMQAKQIKLETIRFAKETLVENARSKPVEARDVTAADITAFAATLEAHINA